MEDWGPPGRHASGTLGRYAVVAGILGATLLLNACGGGSGRHSDVQRASTNGVATTRTTASTASTARPPGSASAGGVCAPRTVASVPSVPRLRVLSQPPGVAELTFVDHGAEVKAKILKVATMRTISNTRGSAFRAASGGALVALTVGFGNLGPTSITAKSALASTAIVDNQGKRWLPADGARGCSDISSSYAAEVSASLPLARVLKAKHGGTTTIVYSLRGAAPSSWSDGAGLDVRLPAKR